jgi:hypothetical protein
LDRPTRISVFVAVAAHVLALVAVRPRALPGNVRDRSVTEGVAIETEIEVIAPEVVEEKVDPLPAAAPAVVAAIPKAIGRVKTVAPMPTTAEVAPAPSGSGAGAGPGAKEEPALAKPVIPELIDTSSPGKHAFILPPSSSGKPMTKEEAIAAKLDASIKGTLDAKDQVIDGGYGGPVVSAAHAAASGIHAPQVGYATFDIETDGKGLVTTVKLVDYGGDLGWQHVQKELQTNLETQRLKVPAGANGVHVRVRVDADMRLPSGAKQKITPQGLGFGFDVSDIGAVKHRVVAVKLVEQHRL